MKDEENDSDILPPMHMLSMKDGESDSAMAQPTRMRSFEEEDNDADEPNHSAFFWRARDSARARPTRMRSFGKEENRKHELLINTGMKGTSFPRPLLKQQMQSASIPPPPPPPPGQSYAFPSADVPAYDISGPDLALQQTRKLAPPPASSTPLTQYRSASPNFSASAYPTLNQVEPVRNSAFRESVSPHSQETFNSCDNISFEYTGPGCASLGDILCDMLSRGSSSPQLGANGL
ncbi:uncharacterized protein LOC117113697 isoform X2 [Anneissia japonica]|uniref:uncharacterized protein LOC117113697 isoform X2 n=1 Tax=Anneissia japonica TaxID=1529436 RepID=UPI001425B54E|nr:uncharacterized protein LOC117113697 isoform X2 [Anneissia japonica]